MDDDPRTSFAVRDAKPDEFDRLGQLMVAVYTSLDGFPSPEEQPNYYDMLAHIGLMVKKPGARLLVAIAGETLLGGIVYFADMAQYGSGGTATQEKAASGFRLLAVSPEARGMGVGRTLAEACITLAKESHHRQVIIHTTRAMQIAWTMYEGMGFRRSEDLDFMQGELPVFGFRLDLA
ncbi:MAG: GNAT family N-acetyltransferase [Acidobacteria bacterium]|nr:GNAT family N-acetyltransferase [Acidobacteriota bacterium]MBI3489324.1 GNAT family N-acetyltransferase [Acidobacteriota bacterium]